MRKIEIRNHLYEIEKDKGDCFFLDDVEDKVTDYFDGFDYIFGDYSYDKLRLKGFNQKNNKNYREINDIEGLEHYIEEFCSYGAKYFLLKKIK